MMYACDDWKVGKSASSDSDFCISPTPVDSSEICSSKKYFRNISLILNISMINKPESCR